MGIPDPHNVPGDFYVEDGCCTACGVPDAEASELFGWDDCGQCFVVRQPRSGQELGKMLTVLSIQELRCIRYRGQDDDVIAHLIANQNGGLVDHPRQLPSDICRLADAVPAPSAFAHRAAGAALRVAARLGVPHALPNPRVQLAAASWRPTGAPRLAAAVPRVRWARDVERLETVSMSQHGPTRWAHDGIVRGAAR